MSRRVRIYADPSSLGGRFTRLRDAKGRRPGMPTCRKQHGHNTTNCPLFQARAFMRRMVMRFKKLRAARAAAGAR